MLKRKEYLVDLSDPKRDPVDQKRPEVKDGSGNLWSSELDGWNFVGEHAPTLDMDVYCELIESTTPGHFHLYIDKPMTWDVYSDLLVAMHNAGLLQKGFVELSLARGASFLRKPGVAKGEGEIDS